tara:strand:+ start:142 stop:606 length:465 start_codon:yes stop_codon:yes gene_type:complete
MSRWSIFFLTLLSAVSQADTMKHYMHIANQIPKMEMKADAQAQAWARSARNVLIITNESIAETLTQANATAKRQNQPPLFCLPAGQHLTAKTLNDLIIKTYNNLSSQQSDKDNMTVSEIAWLGVMQQYACTKDGASAAKTKPQAMQHMQALLDF